ncbi:MAG: class I SAM-dependent methyltransferase [Chloroflexota bacterium]|nr:class I SAM-dependent methyltransferase [Chloroflexota bacterium]
MNHEDFIAAVNKRHWEKMVKEGCGFTRPWLDLDGTLVREYVNGALHPAPEPLLEMYPRSVLRDVDGKDVLCLASGGGQQSAVFGLLGASVTVVDLAEGQLGGDITAAKHYGYEVTALQGDMRDLSMLDDDSFDLVYQAPSISYVPDVRTVYVEVHRVLRSGGLYRAEFTNPATEFVDVDSWDGSGYRITVPYAVRQAEKPGRDAADFRHFLKDIFNGLLETGFSIQEVSEAPRHLMQDVQAPPGSWEHWLMYVQSQFAIVALCKK